jgi:TRAP transporter TAXI family solute receptor
MGNFMRVIFSVAVCMLLVLFAGAAAAQQRAPAQGNELPERDLLNAGTVTVITAPIGGPMSIMGSDMASVLDDGDKLRVLPILGKGSVQNLVDILRLKNIDMGFVTSDALEFAKSEYNIPDIPKRVRYIARLFHNDIHIVARKEIRSLQDLQGKRIFAERSIGFPAARIIFRRLGIEADIDSQTDPDGGLQKLLSGERDAWIASVSKGAPVIKNIKNEAGKFHLLEIPYEKSLQDIYLPSSFSSEEYPNLVAKDTKVYALAVPTVLMTYNWPPESERYRRVARFVDALFGKIGQLQQPPRHPKWRDTGISLDVAGLERFKPAQDWLDKAQPAAAIQSGPTAATAEEFRSFLVQKNGRENVSQQDTAKAYYDFLRWRAGQK